MGYSQCDITFSGQVIDNHDDAPLIGAIVKLTPTHGVVTDEQGNFLLENICAGNYNLTISHIDCEDFTTSISIQKSLQQTFYLEHHEQLLQEAIVNSTAKRGEEARAEISLSEQELQSNQGKTFGDLLENVEGVSLLKTGTTITKPVIDGLHSQRILTINNGIRMEGQQWGIEHAPEIDAYSVQRVSVLKGSGSVEYGADAIGGVVVVEPAPLPDYYGYSITPSIAMFSNGRTLNGGLNILGKQRVFGLPLSFQAQGSLKKAGNLKAPDYYLDNSGAREANFSFRGGYVGDDFGLEFKFGQFNSDLGILTDSHIGTENDLLAIIENGRPFVDRGFSYDLLRPRQEILHEIHQAKAYIKTKLGTLNAEIGRQYNRRAEFDRYDDKPGLRLKTETYTAKANLEHQLSKLTGKIGVDALLQDYRADGFYLIPEYEQGGFGAFLIEQYQVQPNFILEGGLRYDVKEYRYELPFKVFTRLPDEEIEYTNQGERIGIVRNRFTNLLTGNFGATYDFNDQFTASTFVGFGARQPLPNELFSDGVHHGTALWEVGQPNLKVERSANIQLNADYHSELVKARLTSYLNQIQNYIYLQPSQDLDPITTIRGTFPVHEATQNDVQLLGVDYQLSLPLLQQRVEFTTSGAFLRAQNVDTDEPVIYMPSNRVQQKVTYRVNEKFQLAGQLQSVFQQNRVPTSIQDYGSIPDAYQLMGFSASYDTNLAQQPLSIQMSVENALNTSYKDYLDRFRYFAESPGINVGLRMNYFINQF